MPGRLFLCATPIGNLEDASHRLLRILGEVDAVAAEDTRRTRKLLTRYGVRARLVSYHDANERAETPRLLGRLRRGEQVALVSDSGTPLVSDPGFELVRACIEEGIPVEVVPGPSAVLAALAVSGLPTARFAFEGFLPRRPGDRRRRLQAVAGDDRTLVVFEAPGRVAETLRDVLDVLGDRRVAVARELTKVHEEVLRGTVSEVLELLGAREPLGELVLVIEQSAAPEGSLAGAVRLARELVAGGRPKTRAAAEAAERTGAPRRAIYEALVSGEGEPDQPSANGSQG